MKFVSKTYASNFVHSNLFVLFYWYLWIILDLQHFWQQHFCPAAYRPSGFLAERHFDQVAFRIMIAKRNVCTWNEWHKKTYQFFLFILTIRSVLHSLFSYILRHQTTIKQISARLYQDMKYLQHNDQSLCQVLYSVLVLGSVRKQKKQAYWPRNKTKSNKEELC